MARAHTWRCSPPSMGQLTKHVSAAFAHASRSPAATRAAKRNIDSAVSKLAPASRATLMISSLVMLRLDCSSPRRPHQSPAPSGSTIAAASRSRPVCRRWQTTGARCALWSRRAAWHLLCTRYGIRSATPARPDARSWCAAYRRTRDSDQSALLASVAVCSCSRTHSGHLARSSLMSIISIPFSPRGRR